MAEEAAVVCSGQTYHRDLDSSLGCSVAVGESASLWILGEGLSFCCFGFRAEVERVGDT